MKKYFYYLLIIILFFSCCPDRTDKLPDSLKKWVPYQLGEKQYYTDGSAIDSLEIIFYENITNKKGGECGKWYQEELNIHVSGNQINLKVSLNPQNIFFTIPVTPYKFYTYYFEAESNESLVNHTTYELNNNTYNDVLVLTKDSLEIYYGKNKGIIAYRANNNLYTKM